ncbi:hypothetical protein GF356_07650 [candidate division GN15 bacterium]|nr:hypothetical protein [candidate division GN15 bacterium]
MISTNPVSFAFKAANLTFEHAFTHRDGLSISIGGSVFGAYENSGTEYRFFTIKASYQLYRGGDDPFRGMCAGLGVSLVSEDFEETDNAAYIRGQKTMRIGASGVYRFRLGPLMIGPGFEYSVPLEFDRGRTRGTVSENTRPWGGLMLGLELALAFSL